MLVFAIFSALYRAMQRGFVYISARLTATNGRKGSTL